MICPKCKAKLEKNSRYCPRCGELFKAKDIDMFSDIYNLKLLEVYYPNKSERVKIKGVSLLYMFFTYFYAIFHRMYKCTIYSIISLLTFFYLMPRFEEYVLSSWGFYFYLYFFILIACIAIYIFYIFSFDRLLLEKRKNRINYIIRNNPGKSFEEIKELVIIDSKNNHIGVIIAILITFIYFMLKYYFELF